MYNGRCWKHALTLGVLVSALGGLPCGSAATASTLQPAQPEALQGKVDELTSHIQGMEGKLKESAGARKAADQARMEAERRLAEGSQTIERLQAEVTRLEGVRAELTRALAAQTQETAKLEARLRASQRAHDGLEQQLNALRAQVPQSAGGSLTKEQARDAAVSAFEALRDARRHVGRDPSAGKAIATAQDALHRRQFMLAGVTDARSLYRVRPNDSLALISNRFYGSNGRWRAIFEANRHLLEDPDQLTPGMTLIIP